MDWETRLLFIGGMFSLGLNFKPMMKEVIKHPNIFDRLLLVATYMPYYFFFWPYTIGRRIGDYMEEDK